MARDTIQIQPPIGGLNRAWSYQSQPPFTFVQGNNVRSFDVLEDRGRIGSRPGLVKAFQQQLGGGSPIRLSSVIRTFNSSGATTFIDNFNGVALDPTNWSEVAAFLAYPTVAGGIASAAAGSNALKGGVLTGMTDINTSAYRQAAINVTEIPGGGTFLKQRRWTVHLDTRANANMLNEGVYVELRWRRRQEANGTDSLSARVFVNGVEQNPQLEDVNGSGGWGSSPGMPTSGTLFISVDSAKTVRASFTPTNTNFLPITFSKSKPSYVPVYTLSAFTLISETGSSGAVKATSFFVSYESTSGGLPPEAAVFSANHLLYRESTSGSLAVVSGSDVDLASDIQLHAANRLQQLFIADYGIRRERLVKNTVATVVDISATQAALKDSEVVNWLALDAAYGGGEIDRDGDALELLSVTGNGLLAGVYQIAGNITGTVHSGAAGTNFKATTNVFASWMVGMSIVVTSGLTYVITAYVDPDEVTISATPTFDVADRGKAFTVASVIFNRIGSGLTATAVSYRILRYPKVYDAVGNAFTSVGFGTVQTVPLVSSFFPAGCRSIVLWGDRLVSCNDPNTPHAWWMSAAGYPLLHDYGDTGLVGENNLTSDSPLLNLGLAAAIAGTQSEFAGLIGEPLVTTIPINDDILIFACRNSFYALTGNPRMGGVMNNISREIGIVGIDAWCRTTDGRLIVLTPDGLYEITTERAISLSREMIPQELLGLTDVRYDVSLNNDVARRGVLIAAIDKGVDSVTASASKNIQFFYDLRTGAFMPSSYDVTHNPSSAITYQPGGIAMPTVLWGGQDGYVRKFDDAAVDDDGIAFDSNVFLGPIRLAPNDDLEGIVHEIISAFESGEGATGYLYVGVNAWTTLESASVHTLDLARRQTSESPRARGNVAYLEIRGTPGSIWIMDSIALIRETVGKLRMS